jgi:hypothetical protein
MQRDVKPNATYGEIRKNVSEPLEWETHRPPEYWEYRRKWVEYPKRMEIPEFPLCLDIETTNVCDLDCIMCPRTILIARGTYGPIGLMNFDFYRGLIDQGAQYSLPSIKLNYLGEPLLHPDLPRQIRYAKDAGVLDTMFNTNATHLTEEKAHEILEAGIDNVFFSVDSAYREKYNAIRIGADFDKVIENIIRFCEIKRKGNYRHVQTRVSLTVMEHDIQELVEFKNFWLRHVDVVGFGLYHDIDGIESPYNPNFTCSQPFQRMFVMWDGVTTPCCLDYERGYVTGKARTTPLKEIWDGPEYQRLREAHTSGRYKEIGICAKCYVPYTSLDGQVIAFEDVEREAKAAAAEQRMRIHTDPDQELPPRALKRKARSRI